MRSIAKRQIFYGLAWVFAMLLTACSTTRELIVLLPEDDGTRGTVAIGEGDRSVIISAPMAAAKIDAHPLVKEKWRWFLLRYPLALLLPNARLRQKKGLI